MTQLASKEKVPSNPSAPRDIDSPGSTLLLVLSRFMLPLVLIVFATPFVILLFYSVPALDDFCKATLSYNAVPQRSVVAITWMYYSQWSPRWVTTLLQSFVLSHVDLARAYGWLLLGVVIANLAALRFFFKTVFCLARANALLVAGVFYAAYVSSLADPAQQLYWVTGAIEYNLTFSTLLVLVTLLYQHQRRFWYYPLVGLLAFIVPAEHEIAGIFLFMVLAAGIVLNRIWRHPAMQWYIGFGAATVSQVIVMLSRGNALRAAQEHRKMWDIAHLPNWVAHSFFHGVSWLSYPAILFAACSIFLLSQPDQELKTSKSVSSGWLGFAGICAMFAVWCEVTLAETASGHWIPYRVIAWFQLVFWLLLVCVIMTGIPELHRIHFSLGTRIGVFALLAVALLGSENFRAALADLRGPAQAWRRASNSRLHQSGGSMEFQPPVQHPRMAMQQNLVQDSGCWVNQCLANYTHAKSVSVKNSTEECPQ